MAKTRETLDAPDVVSRYVRLKPMLVALLGLFALFAAARLYQQAFAWYAGTDTTSPLFERYWLRVFYLETLAALIVAPIYEPDGTRRIALVGGPIIPTFVGR